MNKIQITHTQLNIIITAVEFGYRQREKNMSLERTLASIFDLYEIKKPEDNEAA